jgi:SpoVK/Ycf46/Vps4 family AAA+-type ATPase
MAEIKVTEKELNEMLKAGLLEAKAQIQELGAMVRSLTTPSFSIGVALKALWAPPISLEELKPGVRVRLRDGHPEIRNYPGYAKIIESTTPLDEGMVLIQFEDTVQEGDDGIVEVDSDEIEIEDQPRRDTALIALNGSTIEVLNPEKLDLPPGQQVRVNMATNALVGALEEGPLDGEIVEVRVIHDPSSIEVDLRGQATLVAIDKEIEVDRGDRVVLDKSNSVIKRNLGKKSDLYTVETKSEPFTWEMIGGLELAKEMLKEAIIDPVQNPELFAFYNIKASKGILFYGPPGNGKTLLGRATHTEIARLHGMEAQDSGFIYIQGPEVLNPYVGQSEMNIRGLFARGRAHKKKYGYPGIVFIDEADAILNERGTGISSDIDRTIVATFLNEMDGLNDSGVIVILATNRPDSLDPAIVRDGRIDRRIYIGAPDEEQARKVLLVHLKKVPISKSASLESIIDSAVGKLYHARSFSKSKENISSAMLAGLVNRAAMLSMKRDLANNTQLGLTEVEMLDAIDLVQSEQVEKSFDNIKVTSSSRS